MEELKRPTIVNREERRSEEEHKNGIDSFITHEEVKAI